MRNLEFKEFCPKCERPECVGDCGLYTSPEKEAYLKHRYLNESANSVGQLKVDRVQLAKNPIGSVSIGGYKFRSKKKKK